MRNVWRVLTFDVAAPLAAIAALLAIGMVLAWPAWWVSLCSVLVLLIVEGVAVNVFLLRRDSVTVGTDDDAPGLRLAVVALCTAAVIAAVLTGYRHWTTPDHDLKVDTAEVVRIATGIAESTATFSPQEPMAAIDRAVAMMVPEQGNAFRDQFGKATTDLAHRNVTAHRVDHGGGPRGDRTRCRQRGGGYARHPERTGRNHEGDQFCAARDVTKQQNHWLVVGVSPLNAR